MKRKPLLNPPLPVLLHYRRRKFNEFRVSILPQEMTAAKQILLFETFTIKYRLGVHFESGTLEKRFSLCFAILSCQTFFKIWSQFQKTSLQLTPVSIYEFLANRR